MFIFYFVGDTKHQVSLNCNENKEISVANLFNLRNEYNVVFIQWDKRWRSDFKWRFFIFLRQYTLLKSKGH